MLEPATEEATSTSVGAEVVPTCGRCRDRWLKCMLLRDTGAEAIERLEWEADALGGVFSESSLSLTSPLP